MSSFNFKFLSSRARGSAAVFATVASLASLSAVVVVFASASGELEPVLAKLRPEPAASATVASKAPPRRVATRDSS